MPNSRFILYHKHPTSARVLFFRLNDTVCHFEALPSESKVGESNLEAGQIAADFEEAIAHTEQKLGLANGTLEIETDFLAKVDRADDPINIYLARFTTTDPPHEQIEDLEGKFIALTEARRLPPVELELLRLVYSFLMDG